MSNQTSDSAMAVVRNYFNAIDRMDATMTAASYADDGVMHTPCLPSTFPRTQTGRAAIEQVFGFLFTQVFKKFSWVGLEIYAAEGDPTLVFSRCRSDCELTDGRPYANEYACISRVREGRLIEHTEFFDTERAIESFKHLS